jgi:SAM-dependent methyltransferase
MNLAKVLAEALPTLVTGTLSDPRHGDVDRIRIRPVLLKGARHYQFEELKGPKAFHRNLSEPKAVETLVERLSNFRRGVFKTEGADLQVEGGRVTRRPTDRPPADAAHDRGKSHLLAAGTPVPFLVRLGIMGKDGKVFAAKQDKFRQINRYLEFVDDIAGALPAGRIRVVDFGCGKSYLTFALHHLLRVHRRLDVGVVGVDLKEDVIADCSAIARELGLEGLSFVPGDIAGFRGVDRADLVVSLHACDTATDEAIAKAVGWGASAILAAPCCQHEVAASIANDEQSPLLRHGILKERVASLVTDALRAELLERAGYAAQVVEFIDTEHTPKNLMIRAVKRGTRKDGAAYHRFRDSWGVAPLLLERLLEELPPRPPGD